MDRILSVHVKISVVAVCLVLTALIGSRNAQAETPEWSTLKQGRVVVKDVKATQPTVDAKILIPRPPDQVWSTVLQPERLMDKEKKVKQIKVVSKTGSTQDLNYTVTMASVLPTLNYTLRHQVTQPNMLQFRRLSGSFKDIQGYWQVTPADSGKSSILTYHLSIDPGPLMPRFMMQNLLKSDLPTMMKNVKAVIAPGS